ncbi:MAG: O-antigen ligase family protein [Chloroflexi bacterium]|nr:O-antigen ligase family protein [Chloroflexota bacterium]
MRVESAATHSRLITWLDRLSAAMWIIFAVMLPFELKSPLITIAPLAITNVELTMYGAIGLWAIRVMVTRRLRWTPVHWAVLAWIAANAISALLAPTLRGEALKFAFRSATGALLFFAAADWAQDFRRVWPIALALGASTIISAGAGVIEVAWPSTAPLWLAFKTHVTVVGEVLRASGTFQYANTAAMFWEAALPIGLAAILSARPMSRRGSIGLAAAVIVVTLAIVLSASRAALIGSAIALLLLIGLNRDTLRRWSAFAMMGLIVLTAAQVIVSPVIAARFRAESDRTWYLAQIDIEPRALTLRAGEISTVPLTVTNISARTWPAGGATPVSVSYHWLSADSQDMIILEGVRTGLPYDLTPGERVRVEARVMAPDRPGDYQLQIDLVQEYVTWFSVRTGQVTEMSALVTSASAVVPAPAGPSLAQMPTSRLLPRPLPSPTRPELWRIAIELWCDRPVFGIGPDNFRWTYGTLLGATDFNRTVTANSWLVETLVNTGLIGLGSLIGLALTLARAAYRALRESAGMNHTLAAGLIAALLAFAVHGLVDYFLPFTPTYGLFWLTAGLLTARGGARHDAGDRL